MAIRTCPICQTEAEPLTDADGKQFCRSCDLQLPPPDHPANATPRPKVVTARPVANDDHNDDERPRKAKPSVASSTLLEEPAGRGSSKMIAGIAILLGAFVAMIVFFVVVIAIKTSAKPTPTTAPKSMATWGRAPAWPGGGPGGFDPDFDRPPVLPPPSLEWKKPDPPKPPR